MIERKSWWQKISPLVYVGVVTGIVVGGWLGSVACFGYDFWNGPFLPQAGVDPNPAGWEGWWIGGGAILGAVIGLVISSLAEILWRAIQSPRRAA